jgi:metallo-beta-lactamase class B
MLCRVRTWIAAALATTALAGGADAQTASAKPYDPPTSSLPPRVQRHIDQAFLVLNGAISDQHIRSQVGMLDPKAFPPVVGGAPAPQLPATRVFDQLYYLGIPFVSAWALVTTDGIILFDSLENAAEAEQHIEGGLRSLGLDPARIKYVIVTHAHADHYGGAKYLQEKYKARVLMSTADWEFVPAVAGQFAQRYGPPPTRDMEITDGQTLVLGKTTISFHVSPGHTPGALSTIFTVTEKGRPHVVSFFGGTGLQTIDKDPAKGGFATMRSSLQRFAKISVDVGADVILSNHPFTDGAYVKVAAQRAGKPGSTQPWVAGRDAVLRFYVAFIEMVDAVEAYYEETPRARAALR